MKEESVESVLCENMRVMDLDQSFVRLLKESFHQATRSLSGILGREMILERCAIRLVSGETFIGQLEHHMEEPYFASILSVEQRFDSNIVFLLTEEEGRRLYGILYGEDAAAVRSEDLIDSIGELNNILGNAVISSMANAFGWELHGSVPKNSFDLLGAILQGIVLQDRFIEEDIVCAEARIADRSNEAFNVRLLVMMRKNKALALWGR